MTRHAAVTDDQDTLVTFLRWLRGQRARTDAIGALANEVCDQPQHGALWRSISDLRRWIRWYGSLASIAALERARGEFRSAPESAP